MTNWRHAFEVEAETQGPNYRVAPYTECRSNAPVSVKFQGSENYVAMPDLMLAVNAAATLKCPLLVKGEPGTGKTMLVEEVSLALGMPLMHGTSNRPPRRSKVSTRTTQ